MRMTRNGEEIPALLPMSELISKLSRLVTEDDPEDIDRAFWAESHQLQRACRDGMEELMWLARHQDIGWEMNAGSRCDVSWDLYSVSVCDNSPRGDRSTHFDDIHARTPQGALAAGILAVLQDRAAKEVSVVTPASAHAPSHLVTP